MSIDDVPLGAFGNVICSGSDQGVKHVRALCSDSSTKLIALRSNRRSSASASRTVGLERFW